MAKRSLKKPEGLIVKGEFNLDKAKFYIIIAIVMFHIIPLFFAFMGENGQIILYTAFMLTLNMIFIFGVACFYAVRNGFDFKFPLILAVIAIASLMMYYTYETQAHALMTLMVTGLVYLICSYFSAIVGGFIKKYIG